MRIKLTGKIKARAVPAKAPVKLMKRPNLGIDIARRPVINTTTVRIKALFIFMGFGNFSQQTVFSVMSIAGTIYIGKLPSSPKQYSSCTLEVKLSCGKFIVTMSSIRLPKASQLKQEKITRMEIMQIRTFLKIGRNLSGCYILDCKLRITPFPSKLKTAIPKNNGSSDTYMYLIFSCSSGCSTYSFQA